MADIVTFDPATLQDKVRERIRASFLDLIPEDAWQDLVQREIARFTDVERKYSAPGRPADESPLQSLIRAELDRRFTEKIHTELNRPEYQEVWDGNGHTPGDAVKVIIQQSIPALVEGLFGSVVQHAVSSIRQSMANMPQRY